MGNSGSGEVLSDGDLEAFQSETNFNEVELKKLIASFDKESDEDGKLDRAAWKRVLASLKKAGLRDLSDDPFADDLYDFVDTNGDGRVDKAELLSGLSMTCKGSPNEKIDLMFQLWDTDKDGRIDPEELETMFIKAYRSAFHVLIGKKKIRKDAHARQEADVLARSLGPQIASQIFPQIDKDGNGYIDKSEFAAAFEHGGLTIDASLRKKKVTKAMGFF